MIRNNRGDQCTRDELFKRISWKVAHHEEPNPPIQNDDIVGNPKRTLERRFGISFGGFL